jgi:ribosomal protein S18 acetylase RimI-like enzyme
MVMPETVVGAFSPFSVALELVIRPCRKPDLAVLDRCGVVQAQRHALQLAFERHEQGEVVMLVAEANGVASGQTWIDLTRQDMDATGYIWSVCVAPCLRNLGIGTRLMRAAEDVLIRRGFKCAELTVEKVNSGARRLYERLGYRDAELGNRRVQVRLRVPSHQWLMQKEFVTVRSEL